MLDALNQHHQFQLFIARSSYHQILLLYDYSNKFSLIKDWCNNVYTTATDVYESQLFPNYHNPLHIW